MADIEYCEPADVGLDPDRFKLIEARCNEWVDEGVHKTIGVLVARHGKIAFHKAFGRAGPAQEDGPLALDSVFPVSSVSKPMVGALAMMMVEDGLLHMTGPVSFYLPEMNGDGTDAITVLDLLRHTSGFRDDSTASFTAEKFKERIDVGDLDDTQHPAIARVLKARWDMPANSEPGTRMDYCAHNYDLVGEILRRISGSSLEDLAQQRLFKPLGMADSSFRLLDHLRDRVVKRDPVFALPLDLNSEKALDQPWASGGALSTTIDLMRFGQFFLGDGKCGGIRLLSRLGLGELKRSQTGPDVRSYFFRPILQKEVGGGPADYGIGWFVQTDHKHPINGMLQARGTMAHIGAGGSRLWVDSEHDMVGVILTADSSAPMPGTTRHQHLQDMILASIT